MSGKLILQIVRQGRKWGRQRELGWMQILFEQQCESFTDGWDHTAGNPHKFSSTPSPWYQIPFIVLKRLTLSTSLINVHCFFIASSPDNRHCESMNQLHKPWQIPTHRTNIMYRKGVYNHLSKNQWLSYMLQNDCKDKTVQRVFNSWPSLVAQSTNSRFKLARAVQKVTPISYLNLANVYGSFHHQLIQFTPVWAKYTTSTISMKVKKAELFWQIFAWRFFISKQSGTVVITSQRMIQLMTMLQALCVAGCMCLYNKTEPGL